MDVEELAGLIADADPEESIPWNKIRAIATHLINHGVRIAEPEGAVQQ